MAVLVRHLIFRLSWLCFAVGVYGQTSSVDPTREVNLRFTVFTLGEAGRITYIPRADAEPQELKFYGAYRSPDYAYRGPETLCFFDDATSDVREPVATYSVPDGASRLLLLFFPKESPSDGGVKYHVHGVDEGLEKIPAGSFYTVNLSGRDYVGQYGNTRIDIPQGVSTPHNAKGRISLRLATYEEGDWRASGRHDFSVSHQERVTLLLYPPASKTGIYPVIRRLVHSAPPGEKGSLNGEPQVP